MYLVLLKSMVVEGLRASLSAYVDPDFTNTNVSIDYPMERAYYPGVWVTYDDTNTLEIASIDHREFSVDSDNVTHEFTRWNFAGTVTMTVVALSSMERDRLYDQLVRVYAFGRIEDSPSPFRDAIEGNNLIAANVNWDELRPGNDAAAPGTPWGTDDEVIYEKSLSFDVIGEFTSDPSTNAMVLLSAIEVMGVDSDLHPEGALFSGEPGPGVQFDPTVWA